MTVDRVRVGDVLELQRREVTIDPIKEYELIGIYSFGKGIFHREPTAGGELGAYRFFSIRPGDLVVSNIQAWEGAIGLATTADHGTIGTHRFLSYTPVDDRINANWARWFFLSEPGMDLVRAAAPGSTTRNRTLAVERFEALEIPLPSIEQQASAADFLDRFSSSAVRLLASMQHSTEVAEALVRARQSLVLSRLASMGHRTRRLGDVAEINPRPRRIEDTELALFVPMAEISGKTGRITATETRLATSVDSGYKQFLRGDIVFARITPCMQNGKTAIFRTPQSDLAYGSTEFHVVRPGPAVSEQWLHRVMRSHEFRMLASKTFKGTAGQQRVPADFLRTAEIPVPPLDVQREAVSAIDLVATSGDAMDQLQADARRRAASLMSSALNSVFGSLI